MADKNGMGRRLQISGEIGLKSVFAKVLSILIVVLIISFSVTAVLLSAGIDRLITDQRSDQLRVAAEKIEEGLEAYLTDASGLINSQLFISFIQAISENTNSMIWIVRNDGPSLCIPLFRMSFLSILRSSKAGPFSPISANTSLRAMPIRMTI
jgi:hypothetical protein